MIRAAVVGLGWWGKIITQILASSRKIRVMAAAEPDPATREGFGRETGIRCHADFSELLEAADVDAVILTSPHRFHERQIIEAAQAGKHVFCEKPLTLSLTSAERAVQACLDSGVRLAVGHERRFEPPMRLVRQMLASGELGELLAIEGNFSHDKFLALPPGNWRLSRAEAACGPMTATGIHLLDMSVSLGGGAREVYASNRAFATGFESGDTLSTHITLSNGAVANINAMLATPFYSRFTVFGTRGWIEIRDKSHVEAPTGWHVTQTLQGRSPEVREYPAATPVLENLEAFADAIASGRQEEYPIPLQEMLNTVAAYEAVHTSTLEGRLVPVQAPALSRQAAGAGSV